MKTVVLANQKGGVGKSAVACLLAHYLAQQGRRVLAIDLDHQGNFTSPLARSGRVVQAVRTSDGLYTDPAADVPGGDFVLVPAGQDLLALERQAQQHSPFARNMRRFLHAVDTRFDVCVIDTHPNPDIRLVGALVSADFVISPIQLNREALEGVNALLNHQRAGVRKIKALLNPKLDLIGVLPSMVQTTPFQRANFVQFIEKYYGLLIRINDGGKTFASIPHRSAIAEAQAVGEILWEMKKTAARDCWKEIEPTLRHLAGRLTGEAGPATAGPATTSGAVAGSTGSAAATVQALPVAAGDAS